MVPELGMLLGAFVVDGFDHVARPHGLAAVRGGHTTGAPLLYPWANRLARLHYTAAGRKVSLRGLPLHTDDAGRPIHGTMIGRDAWTVTAAGRGRVEARCDFGDQPDLLDAFPFPHVLRVSVRVGRRRVRVDTTVDATGATPVPVSFGWHPYWQLPGRRDDWSVALPDVAHAASRPAGDPHRSRARVEPAGTRVLRDHDFDDLYAFAGARTAELRGDGRRLRLAIDGGYPYLQVFAPADRGFCCLEPMTAPTNALVSGDHPTVRPGASFTASFTASVRIG